MASSLALTGDPCARCNHCSIVLSDAERGGGRRGGDKPINAPRARDTQTLAALISPPACLLLLLLQLYRAVVEHRCNGLAAAAAQWPLPV